MNLRTIAEADLAVTLEDDVNGFGFDIKITDPDGNVGDLIGQSNDIAQLIDPDTGTAISGRFATAVVRLSSLTAVTPVALGIPVNISDAAKKPWVVEFKDINGITLITKVQHSSPDRTLGVVLLILESYTP